MTHKTVCISRRLEEMNQRADNWAGLLAEYVAAKRDTPFKWGVHDCGSFAAEWVGLATGRDVFAPWRGKYSTRWGAFRYILGAGGMDRFPAKVGLKPCPPKRMQRGDIASIPTTRGIALGVCIGKAIVAPGTHGLEFLSTKRARHAWRV